MALHGRKLVDGATAVLIGHLLLQQATANDRKGLVARRFIEPSIATLRRDMTLLCSGDKSALEDFETLAGPPAAAS
jgi:hypothetical protein